MIVGLALASLGGTAAAGAPDGGSRYRSGLEAFRAGDFARARAEFEAALAGLPPGDALVFQSEYNLARTVEEQGRPCDAAGAFERFLAHAPQTTAVERGRAEKARAAQARTRGACDAARAEAASPRR